MTIFPNFKPSARIKERSPPAFGWASWTSTSDADILRFFFDSDKAGLLLLALLAGLVSGEFNPAEASSSSSASTIFFFGGMLLATIIGWRCFLLSSSAFRLEDGVATSFRKLSPASGAATHGEDGSRLSQSS